MQQLIISVEFLRYLEGSAIFNDTGLNLWENHYTRSAWTVPTFIRIMRLLKDVPLVFLSDGQILEKYPEMFSVKHVREYPSLQRPEGLAEKEAASLALRNAALTKLQQKETPILWVHFYHLMHTADLRAYNYRLKILRDLIDPLIPEADRVYLTGDHGIAQAKPQRRPCEETLHVPLFTTDRSRISHTSHDGLCGTVLKAFGIAEDGVMLETENWQSLDVKEWHSQETFTLDRSGQILEQNVLSKLEELGYLDE